MWITANATPSPDLLQLESSVMSCEPLDPCVARVTALVNRDHDELDASITIHIEAHEAVGRHRKHRSILGAQLTHFPGGSCAADQGVPRAGSAVYFEAMLATRAQFRSAPSVIQRLIKSIVGWDRAGWPSGIRSPEPPTLSCIP